MYEDRHDYEEAVRALLEQEMVDVEADGPEFRWTEVRIIRERRAGTRIAVIFHRDAEPGVTYGYWGYIWEKVAWEENYGPQPSKIREQPGNVATDFWFYMDLELESPKKLMEAGPPDAEGIRWIRSVLVWA